MHLRTPTGAGILTRVQRPTRRNRWSPAPHPHAVHSGLRQSLPAVCLTLSPGALQLGWPAVWRWTCIGGWPLACLVGREGPAGSTDWIQTVPWDSGETSLSHRAFPDVGTTQTLGLMENHTPWGPPHSPKVPPLRRPQVLQAGPSCHPIEDLGSPVPLPLPSPAWGEGRGGQVVHTRGGMFPRAPNC